MPCEWKLTHSLCLTSHYYPGLEGILRDVSLEQRYLSDTGTVSGFASKGSADGESSYSQLSLSSAVSFCYVFCHKKSNRLYLQIIFSYPNLWASPFYFTVVYKLFMFFIMGSWRTVRKHFYNMYMYLLWFFFLFWVRLRPKKDWNKHRGSQRQLSPVTFFWYAVCMHCCFSSFVTYMNIWGFFIQLMGK